MKFLKKAAIFTIITSFILSSDVFAITRDEGGRRAATIKRSVKRTSSAIERNVRTARKRTVTRTNSRVSRPVATRSRAGQAPGIRKGMTRRNTQAATGRRSASARSVTRRQVPAQINRASTSRTARNVSNTRFQAAQRTRTASPTRGIVDRRQVSGRASRHYTVNTNDFPDDLKADLMLVSYVVSNDVTKGATKKATCQQIQTMLVTKKATSQQFQTMLIETQNAENKLCGITQKLRHLFLSQGYNPASAGNCTITTTTLTEDQKSLLKTVLSENQLAPSYSVPQAAVTKKLNAGQEIENRSTGLTRRFRNFLKSKGFQG